MNLKTICLLLTLLISNISANFASNNTHTSKDKSSSPDMFQLEIKINGWDMPKSPWILQKFDPRERGCRGINIKTGIIDPFAPSLLKSKDGKFKVKGKINDPTLYMFYNPQLLLSFPFMLSKGRHELELNFPDLNRERYMFNIPPFVSINSPINEDLLHFWSTEGMQNYVRSYKKYINWLHTSLEELWGVPYTTYCNLRAKGKFEKLKEIKEKRKITKEQVSAIQEEQEVRLKELHDIKATGVINYIEQYPNNPIGLQYLVSAVYIYGHKEIKLRQRWSHLKMFGNELHQHSNYKYLLEKHEQLNKVKIGNLAPDFELPDINGDHLKLSDLRGNIVLVEFWKSNCDYCKSENNNLQNIYARYQHEDFQILSVSFDEKNTDWRKALNTYGNPWLNVREPDGYEASKIIDDYAEAGIPYYFLIDKNGRLLAKKLRQPSAADSANQNLNIQLEKIFNY